MCNCRKETEQRLIAKVAEQLPPGAKELTVELTGYAFLFGGADGITMKNSMPIRIEYQSPNKKGEFKPKKQTMTMTGGYCMFCGEKYEKAPVEADAA